MRKVSRVVSFILVVGLMGGIPAATQSVPSTTDSTLGNSTPDDINLALLTLINRLELSDTQMSSLHDILANLLEQYTTLDDLRTKFENDMIAFRGTSDELDTLLSSYQDDRQAAINALQTAFDTARDQIGDLLTANQGSVLQNALPGLLGGTETSVTANGSVRELGLNRLRQRVSTMVAPQIGRSTSTSDGSEQGTAQTYPCEPRSRSQQPMGRLPGLASQRWGSRPGVASGTDDSSTSPLGEQAILLRNSGQRPLLQMLEQVVQILELKMEAVG
jgi:hypothetical protein